jgi:hypothetical protein
MAEELAAKRTTPCVICDKPVELETARTDERGRAVREDCYFANLKQRRRLRIPGRQDQEIGSPPA